MLLLLTKQMEHYTLSHDSCCLFMRWVDRIIELLVTDKEKTEPLQYQTQFDALAMQLLAFSECTRLTFAVTIAPAVYSWVHKLYMTCPSPSPSPQLSPGSTLCAWRQRACSRL